MIKKILVTGFEPFGNDTFNPSSAAVQRLEDKNGYHLKKLTLPVTWQGAFSMLSDAWDEFAPDAVLMVGLAGGSDKIRVERLGMNLRLPAKDNLGRYPNGSETDAAEMKISADGADAYFATYDNSKILSSLRGAGIPAAYSFSAGAYLCNNILYSALEKNKREAGDVKIGFLHVPYAEGQRAGVPSLPLDTIILALELALSNIF